MKGCATHLLALLPVHSTEAAAPPSFTAPNRQVSALYRLPGWEEGARGGDLRALGASRRPSDAVGSRGRGRFILSRLETDSVQASPALQLRL